MNINIGEEGGVPDLSPFIIGNASPSLSPFLGSLSPALSIEDQPKFTLENCVEEQECQHGCNESAPYDLLLIQGRFQEELLEDNRLDHTRENLNHQDSKTVLFGWQHEHKQEHKSSISDIKTPSLLPSKSSPSKAYAIISYLTTNLSNLDSDSNPLKIREILCGGDEQYEYIFDVLHRKFRKLRKTKEQMIKFCMRKAFKFITDLKLTEAKNRKLNHVTNQTQINNSFTDILMPFKKNSAQKTMNNQFLKQTFSNEFFRNNYHKFLEHLSGIIQEDNQGKIKYLADMIETMLYRNEISNIEGVKRLPWTKKILDRVQDLAHTLFRDFGTLDQHSENEGHFKMEHYHKNQVPSEKPYLERSDIDSQILAE